MVIIMRVFTLFICFFTEPRNEFMVVELRSSITLERMEGKSKTEKLIALTNDQIRI